MVGDMGTSGHGVGTVFEDIGTSRGLDLPNAFLSDRVVLDEGYVPKLQERVSASSFEHILFTDKTQAKPKKHVYVWQCVSYRPSNWGCRSDGNSADVGVQA
jgi:hypothetical protein